MTTKHRTDKAFNDRGGESMPSGNRQLICALAMALGTATGGWKIIKTMGSCRTDGGRMGSDTSCFGNCGHDLLLYY